MAGLVVIDVDPGHGGNESLHDLQARLSRLPETVTALTGGGGEHRLFRAPSGRIVKSTNGIVATGIDLKAAGGYIIAVGSRHISGALYVWDAAASPDDITLAELPTAWLERLSVSRTMTGPPRGDASISEGGRHDQLVRLAGVMRRYGFSVKAIEAALLETNISQCLPPLPDDEVIGIAASCGRYAPAGRCERRKRVLTA